MKAKLISSSAGRNGNLCRWECPICRTNKEPECRFNLTKVKTGGVWPCRFCKTLLELKSKFPRTDKCERCGKLTRGINCSPCWKIIEKRRGV